MLGISCGTWDIVPWSGTEARPPALGAQSLSPGTTREVPFFFLILKKILFILAVPGLLHCTRTFSSSGEQGATPDLQCEGFWSGLSCCRAQAPAQASGVVARGLQELRLSGSRTWVQQLRCTGLAALRLAASSWATDGTHVPCIGRWILNPWTTREVPQWFF